MLEWDLALWPMLSATDGVSAGKVEGDSPSSSPLPVEVPSGASISTLPAESEEGGGGTSFVAERSCIGIFVVVVGGVAGDQSETSPRGCC
ncbi:hypothetical protein C8F04DRAFT_1154469 [Mycena alexandri]|uniref:Uncharacterized protein n=1 Tax=Mycena alexandri TaxID=1745969 RepID=A0AAD6WNG3_9AGAR|nr:hypothetical protein C8F04DRAFT_1154469 [Mycena alexandri]